MASGLAARLLGRTPLLVCIGLSLTAGSGSSAAGDGNCGVEIPLLSRAGDPNAYESVSNLELEVDLEDDLWSLSAADTKEYRRLRANCGDSSKLPGRCKAFGAQQWNLSTHQIVALEGVREDLCDEDLALVKPLKRYRTKHPCKGGTGALRACQRIDGQVRMVGLVAAMTHYDASHWSQLPHLFSLYLQMVNVNEDFSDIALPASMRVLTIYLEREEITAKLAPLLKAHGKIKTLNVYGNQAIERWHRLDLSHFCGLDLIHFNAYVVNVGQIPECWSAMRNLESFYCTNCMMTSPPTPLRGLLSLKSFVAFRQSEMTPCVYTKVPQRKEDCKASWESRALYKGDGRTVSTGEPEDFQVGPSMLCAEASYSFPFRDFLDLGWTNVEKVWLDGNFLTGEIPYRIAEVWPSLQSLDLYDNRMEGPIPESISRLNWVKLQLQGNNFSGRVPRSVTEMTRTKRMVLGLQGNPYLEGCSPPGGEDQVAMTKLVRCDDHGDEL